LSEDVNILKSKEIKSQGIFFNGQVFDAYTFISDLLRTAKKEVILIDNYIDDAELYHIGASLKDVGNKWFAFSKMDISLKNRMISKI
jgi:archaellum component FlaF (FlaF/FlaG flagellin family)